MTDNFLESIFSGIKKESNVATFSCREHFLLDKDVLGIVDGFRQVEKKNDDFAYNIDILSR